MANGPSRLVLVAVLLLAPVLGWLKVDHQRANPPAWADTPAHRYEGYVSIDGHARRSAQIRDVLRGEDPGARVLRESLQSELHPSSLSVPLVVGAVALLSGSIPSAFLLVNLALYGLALWLVHSIARLHLAAIGLQEARSCSSWSLVVFAAHVDTCRTVLQLHLDFAVACVGLAVVLLALQSLARPWSARESILVAGLHAFGLFTKFSYLPFLAAAPVAALLGKRTARGFLLVSLTIAVPAAGWGCYMLTVHEGGALVRDAAHFRDAWKLDAGQVQHFALEIALALQWLPLVLVLPRKASEPVPRLVAVIAVLYLSSLLCFGLPAVPRLYLPVVALLSALSVPLLLAVQERAGTWPIHAWVLCNLGLAAVGIRGGD